MSFSWGELAAMHKADAKLDNEVYTHEDWEAIRRFDKAADDEAKSLKQRKRIAYYKRNKDAIRAYHQRYYAANRDRILQRAAAYRERLGDEYRERKRV